MASSPCRSASKRSIWVRRIVRQVMEGTQSRQASPGATTVTLHDDLLREALEALVARESAGRTEAA
jgi:hypothetical protein